MVILLFIIAIIWYHYAKHRFQQKCVDTNAIKVENNELKKVSIGNRTCYYFNDIIKFEGFKFDNIKCMKSDMKTF